MALFNWDIRIKSDAGKVTPEFKALTQTLGIFSKVSSPIGKIFSGINSSVKQGAGELGKLGIVLNATVIGINIAIKAFKLYVDTIKSVYNVLKDLYESSVKVFVPFQRLSNEIEVLAKTTDKSGKDTEALQATIQDLAATSQKTATEVAQMAASMLRSGKTAAEVREQLDDVVVASVALGQNGEKAFSAANAVLSKFNGNLGITVESGNEVKGVLALLTAGANSANTNFNELTTALKRGNSSGLQLFKVSALETVTALGLLANSGLTGTKAMRLLSSNLSTLVQKKDKVAELGIVLTDQEGNFKTLTDVSQQFNDILEDKAPAEQAEILVDIFGKQAQAMSILISAGEEGFTSLRERIEDASNSLEDLAKAQETSLGGAQKRLESVKEGISILIGEIIEVPAKEIILGWAEALDSVRKNLKEAVTNIKNLAKQFEAEGKSPLEAWLKAIDKAVDWDKFWKDFLEAAKPVIDAIDKILKTLVKELVESLSAGLRSLTPDKLIKEYFKSVRENQPFGRKKGKEEATASVTQEAIVSENVEASQRELAYKEDLAAAVQEEIAYQEELAKTQQNILSTSVKIRQEKFGIAKASEEIALADERLNLTLAEMGANLKKYLLEPWDKFRQATLDIKNKFSEIIDTLKKKSIDIQEKFGLITGEEAGKQRAKLIDQTIQNTQGRLELAQSPAEKQKLYEQLAQQLTQKGEIAPEQEKTQIGREAKDALDNALKFAQEDEKIQLEKIKIDRATAEEQVKTLTGARGQAETVTGELEILKQLQSSLMELGQGAEAAALQTDINELSRQAAEEQVVIQREQLEVQKNGFNALLEELRNLQAALGSTQGAQPTLDPLLLSTT